MIDANNHTIVLALHILLLVCVVITLAMVIYLVRKNTNTERRLAEERFAAVEELRRRAEDLAKDVADTLDQRLTSLDEAAQAIKHELGADDGDPTTTTRDKIEDIDHKTEVLLKQREKDTP